MKKMLAAVLCAAIILSLPACSNISTDNKQKNATEITAGKNSEYYNMLDFSDEQERDFATRNLIAAPESLEIKNEDGKVVWSQKAYEFLEDTKEAPDSANPSLWRHTTLNHSYGLFEVCEGIYQVRGYDMSNLTVVETDNGWILFDPLMSVECTQAAMNLVEEHLGARPIKAVIISHSHVDHFGGIKGAVTEEEIADSSLPIRQQLSSGKIPIIVPEGFASHAVSENVYTGNAMGRRAGYQYGAYLEPGEKGRLAIGIGMGQSLGTISYISPTHEIKETGETIEIDGVTAEFQLTPGTEAPAEMNTWFPQYNALWMAENCTGTLHNLYTLRGAQVRDGNDWSKYIAQSATLYGEKVEVAFQSHNWPHWGNETVNEYLENTAAAYKYINDKTLYYINQGYTSDEISNMIQLPQTLSKVWYTRQYYGTVAHNSKAVYQKYMGWYDANPVNLNPLSPSDSAKKWVEYLGDTSEVLKKAHEDFKKGEYQWVAEITNVLVFADPENQQARFLCADALEQLGYQAESGPWRNAYLSAALELRNGAQNDTDKKAAQNSDLTRNMSSEMMLDYLSILLNDTGALDLDIDININISDLNEKWRLHVYSGIIMPYKGSQAADPDVSITCPKNALFYLVRGDYESFSEAAVISGDTAVLEAFAGNISSFDPFFNIIEP